MTQDEFFTLLKNKFGGAKYGSKGFIRIPCPTCTKKNKKKYKRYVSSTYNFTQCYVCQTPLTFAALIGDNVFVENTNELSRPREEHPQAKILPFQHCLPINSLPSDHLAVRFFNKDHLFNLDRYWEEYGVCYVPFDGAIDINFNEEYTAKSAETIVFPVVFKQELVGWQCRYVPGTWYGDKMSFMRYFHLFDKGSYLFNYDKARKYDFVVVVEGIKKALKFPNAVSTLGKGISDNQVQLLTNWKNVVLLLDGDDKTQEYALTLQLRLKTMMINCVNIDLRKYGFPSPDEMTEEQVAFVINEHFPYR